MPTINKFSMRKTTPSDTLPGPAQQGRLSKGSGLTLVRGNLKVGLPVAALVWDGAPLFQRPS
ncbi:hypothetical protein [Methylobacterium pseudosasicola]|nr:hypothetical protein [Methylobacterium pseudosasicola]